MERVQRDPAPAQGRPDAEFFIPDLCTPRATLLLVLLTQLMVLVYTLAGSSLRHFDWNLLATTSLFAQWVVLMSALLLCRLRAPLSVLGLRRASAAAIALITAVTLLTSSAVMWAFPQLPARQDGLWWALRNGLIAAVLSGMVLRYFFLRQELRVREQSELQARLDSLRARIRPHFLFNTLNSIASLIALRPQAAEQAVEDLSELFRASLQESQLQTSVADELRLCELYLEIERLRLGERLCVEWSVPEALRPLPMPSLTLQPLVENAVYHGIALLPEGGTVSVALAQENGCLRAVVENPLPGQASRSSGHRLALANIEQRLQALFGERGSLRCERLDGIYRAELRFPVGDAA